MSTEQLAALLAEAVPDGTFGGARTLRSVRGGSPRPASPTRTPPSTGRP